MGRVWVTYSRRGRKYWSSEPVLLITSFQFSCRERQTERERKENVWERQRGDSKRQRRRRTRETVRE